MILTTAPLVAAQTPLPSSPAPTTSPAPAPTSTPAAASDPCGSLISIVGRPSVSTGVCTVRPKRVELETGLTNTVTTGNGGGNSVSYPQALIRVGTSIPQVEIDFAPPSQERSSLGGSVETGQSDVAFGARDELGYTAKALWGVSASVSVPSGSPAFTAGGTQYTGNFNWGYTVNSVFGISGTLGYNSLTAFGANGVVQRYASFNPSLLLSATLDANSQTFIEYAYFGHAGLGLGGKGLIDASYERDFSQHLQADIEYGISPIPIDNQRQHYFGFGLSVMN